MTPKLSAKSSADLLAFVPVGLGFWPSDSLVVLSIRESRLGATLRIDLPSSDADVVSYAHAVAGMASADDQAEGFVAAIYTDDSADENLVDALSSALPRELQAVFLVQNEQVRSLITGESFIVADIKASPLALELSMLGRGYTPSSEVEIPKAPVLSDRETETYEAVLESFESLDRHKALEMVRDIWREYPQQETISLSQYKGMLAVLQNKVFRDIAIGNGSSPDPIPVEDEATLCHYLMGSASVVPDWNRTDATEKVLMELLTIAPTPYRPAPFCALAVIQWKKGRASRADSYIKAALDIDPTYRLAVLLKELFSRSVICDWAKDRATSYTGTN